MRDKPARDTLPTPAAFINAQSAITGLRGRDLISTLRSVAAHGLRNPVHSARHALKLGGQLGRVLLGETLHPTNPQDSRFADPAWSLNPFYRRSLQAYLAWQKQVKSWIDDSNMSPDDRARAHFAFALLNDAVSPSNSLLNPLAIKEIFNSGSNSLRGSVTWWMIKLHNDGLPRQVTKQAFEVGKTSPPPPAPWCFATNCWN